LFSQLYSNLPVSGREFEPENRRGRELNENHRDQWKSREKKRVTLQNYSRRCSTGQKKEGQKPKSLTSVQLTSISVPVVCPVLQPGIVYMTMVSLLFWKKMKKAEGIVLGSPVYIDSVTAQLKRWIDRSANAMHCMMLLGKYGCTQFQYEFWVDRGDLKQ
jgi:hypothetical protein